MNFNDTIIVVFVGLLSATGYSLATQADSKIIPFGEEVLPSKDGDRIKKLKSLRLYLIAKLREADRVWKTLPVASAIKLWGDNKSLVTEPTFSQVEALLKKGENEEAMALLDDFIRLDGKV